MFGIFIANAADNKLKKNTGKIRENNLVNSCCLYRKSLQFIVFPKRSQHIFSPKVEQVLTKKNIVIWHRFLLGKTLLFFRRISKFCKRLKLANMISILPRKKGLIPSPKSIAAFFVEPCPFPCRCQCQSIIPILCYT